ncbi:MAG: MFS transporter [Nitrospirales bacterium]|nr:MFS transporter [Nitrospirales bacterium]
MHELVSRERPAQERLRVRERHLLLSRDFGLVWWGQLISQVGDGVSKLALLWFVYSVTGSPIKTTVIGMLQTIPPIIFGPLIGVYLDRLPKKPVLIISDLLRAVLIGLIPCWVSPSDFTVEVLYVLVFLHALATAVFGPALTASVPHLVKPAKFTAANAWLQTTTSLGVILGPALSGIGIAALSSQSVLCVNAVTYVVSALCLLPVRFPWVHASSGRSAIFSSPVHDLMDGLRFAKQQIVLLLIVIAALHSFGTAAFSTLFPVFGRKMLDLGPVEVGYLWSALGVGLFFMSLGLVRMTEWHFSARLQVIAISSGISGAALFGLAGAPNSLTAALCMVVIGAGIGAFTPIAWGVLQEVSPERLVARVLTIYGTGAMTAAIAGMTTFGWSTEQFGERASVIGIGVILIATAALVVTARQWIAPPPNKGRTV